MSDIEKAFHESWLGMVQPIEGLVVSIPVLIEKQCFERHPPALHYQLQALCGGPANDNATRSPAKLADVPEAERRIDNLPRFLAELLGLTPDLWSAKKGYQSSTKWAGTIPEAVSVYAPEGPQTVVPTLALRRQGPARAVSEADGEAAQAASVYELLLWEVPEGVSLDKNECVTGAWDYPPTSKLERLLRAARVPIGLLSNGQVLRLIYAPHGEATGHLDFRIADMWQVGGRPILDALVMLLHVKRFFSVAEERSLPAILAESRKYQANVTNQLGEQVFEALSILLRGFEAAAERDGQALLEQALARENDHLYQGLLTVLLRIVFVLFAEDRQLLPIEHPLYEKHYSLFALYERLQADHGAFPDSMSRRFGAWGQLVALFRALYSGVSHGELKMPARRGTLFNPNLFAFLEGWDPEGTAPIGAPQLQAEVKLPTLDDETVYLVLHKLIMLDGQRLSYRTLDVEQIGSVYEGLMGFHVARMAGRAVRMRPDGVWLTAEELLEVSASRRAAFLAEHVNLPKAQAKKLADEIHGAKKAEAVYEELQAYGMGRTKEARAESCARAGQLVLQPGKERRRTSSHYTPRSLSSKVVDRTLEPLLRCMTEEGESGPSSERILQLRICDPAMGSGAFLVESCRYLGDALVAAWTREKRVSHYQDPVLAARRRVAQCCLYGVDKNPAAVELAKLSLWLVTLAKHRPFTFLDGNLRHGDSLVGLSVEQLKAFHWSPASQRQRGFAELRIEEALQEAIECREKLRELAQKENGINPDPGEKMLLLRDADDALDRLRLIGDVCIGAFFVCDKDAAREKERLRRRDLVEKWLVSENGRAGKLEAELRELQAELRRTQVPFHWMIEFPDVFWDKRQDPLEPGAEKVVAYVDAFVGNPPFMGVVPLTDSEGPNYACWLRAIHTGTVNKFDLCAHFFRRCESLLGAHGTIGLIATNTIGQGDTRATGLQWLTNNGLRVYDATTNMPWPGTTAAVTVSIVHLAKGLPTLSKATLDGLSVPAINSQLVGSKDRADPIALNRNTGAAFVGTYVLGKGFVLTPEERQALTARNRRNAQRIFPYLGGEEVNTSPDQAFHRYVISFGQMSLEEAEAWPDLVAVLRANVKPERDKVKNTADGMRFKSAWWLFARDRPNLYEAIAPLSRCLVAPNVTKHVTFAFEPTTTIFAHTLCVFSLDRYTAFSVLQSRVHEEWVWTHCSTLPSRSGGVRPGIAGVRYTGSDCFTNFPFPKPDPRTVLPKLENIGQQLYEARAKYMLDTQQGLTKTYNALKDPSCGDKRILELREMHEAMDAAVLAEYGWDGPPVPPFCPKTDADQRALDKFKSKVIDRLYDLNAQRAKEEELAGLGSTKKGDKVPKKATKTPRGEVENDNDEMPKQQKRDSKPKGGMAKVQPDSRARKKAGGGR